MGYAEMNALAEAPGGLRRTADAAVRQRRGTDAGKPLHGPRPSRASTSTATRRPTCCGGPQEGIACSFRYGIDIMRRHGPRPDVIRAGRANLFLSPLFRRTLATLTGARIELFDTDGILGAARGAALGAGLYGSREETFASLRRLEVIEPVAADSSGAGSRLYAGNKRWKAELHNCQVIEGVKQRFTYRRSNTQ